ncbi:MAG: type II toxin-antitoxin system PemK/MazF family toxin [Clostridia bacterium]|nr:type II toxin-antitoxin system PemK/MazF family toxin [Clostridia bacterium]
MKRGEIWTLRDRQYASKARPVVIIQNDDITGFDSVILCLFTTFDSSQIESRVPVSPSDYNGLHNLSYVMTDKIVTVDKKMLGEKIGRLSETDMATVSECLRKILAL